MRSKTQEPRSSTLETSAIPQWGQQIPHSTVLHLFIKILLNAILLVLTDVIMNDITFRGVTPCSVEEIFPIWRTLLSPFSR